MAAFIIGIGSSAGGLEALRLLIGNLPEKIDLALLIAQHMSPQHRSLLTELLARETKIQVMEIEGGEVPEPNCIYICPPNADLTFNGETLLLSPPPKAIGPKPSIDTLFNSMAKHCGEQCAGVILSGTGSDGAHGSRSIRAAGGLTIAQEPSSAQYDSMPQSAIALGGAELIMPPEDIGRQISQLLTIPRTSTSPLGIPPDTSEGPLGDIINKIWLRSKLDFSKFKDSTVGRQVDRRIAAHQLCDLDAYASFIEKHPEELDALAKSFLISVTAFFRDTKAFDAMGTTIEQIVGAKTEGEPIRVWIAGCATGEEAYSMAILLHRAIGGDLKRHPVQIFATDIDNDATAHARKGVYSETTVEGVAPEILQRYFTASSNGYVVDRRIQEMVVFARQDLIRDPPFLRLDMISCRNVMIYFKPELQDHLFQVFHYSLNPGGHLFLGNSEVVTGANDLFKQVRSERIFVRNDFATASPLRLVQFRPNLNFAPAAAAETKKAPPNPKVLLRDQLVRSYAPPSVLVDSNNRLIELFGATEAYFKFGEGSAELDALRLIRPDLRTELRSLLHRIRNAKSDELRGQPVYDGDAETGFQLCVATLDEPGPGRDLYRVSFAPVSRVKFAPSQTPGKNNDADFSDAELQIRELQDELAGSREHLQTVVEELETSNEELQSLNEEMQASGEELQASNEELATSNEELQATNEELTTVNDELQAKAGELSRTLIDLENIQDAASAAIIVVDRDLLVTRFNESAVRTVGLTKADLGRNLTALPVRLPVADLYNPLKKTLKGEPPESFEMTSGDRIYRVDTQPYRDSVQGIHGAVISFSDISGLKNQEFALREVNELFEVFARNIKAVMWVQEPQFGRMIYVNPEFRKVYGLDPEMVLRDPEYIFKVMQREDAERLKTMHINAGSEPWSLVTRIIHPKDGSLHWLSTRAYPVMAGERLRYVTGLTIDVTDEVETQSSTCDAGRLFDLLMDSAADGVIGFDSEAKVRFANHAACEMLGYQASEIEGVDAKVLLDQTTLSALQLALRSNQRQRKKVRRAQSKTKQATELVTDIIISSEPLLLGEESAAVAVLGDPHELRASSRQQQIATNVFRSTQDGVMVLDDETRIVAVNPAAVQILQRDEDYLVGTVPDIFPSKDPRSAFPADIWEALDTDNRWTGEVHAQRSDAEFIVLETEVSVLDRTHGDDDGRYMVVVTDITQRRSYEKTIYRQANFDALTGLPNRALLLDRLSLELRHAARDGYGVTVMFIDLDRFKEVNDSLGHEAGDELLLMVSKRIQELVRSSDTLSRFGGDEFVLMMPKYQRSQAPELTARMLIEALDMPFDLKQQTVFISASVGIAVFPQDGNDTSELLRNADAAMYKAKDDGRRSFAFYQPQMNSDAAKRITLEAELRYALDNHQLCVHYQPIVSARTGRICAMEALVRWQHPELGLLPPLDFMPYAEEARLIDAITAQVLDDAKVRQEEWKDLTVKPLMIAVNFSARHFRKGAFELLMDGRENDLDGLIVEVTESVFADDHDVNVIENLKWLQDQGAKIALDDFGTGFSSLSYVRRFPVDVIKIDRSFVTEAADDPRDGALVEAAVAMAHGVGAVVVAEGVETERQAAKMCSLGADRLQGFLYAKPMPAVEVVDWLAEQQAEKTKSA